MAVINETERTVPVAAEPGLSRSARGGRRRAKDPFLPQNRWAALLGAAVILFACVGVFYMVSSAAGLYKHSEEQATQTELNRYSDLLRPLVMFDPPPFDSVSGLDSKYILRAAVWQAISNLTHHEVDELGYTLVPGTDVRTAAVMLFGDGVPLGLKSFTVDGAVIDYDSVTGAYHIPPMSPSGYWPTVENVLKDKNTVTLTVGYLLMEDEQTGTVPVKRMTFVLTGEKGGEIIKACRK